MGGQNLVREDSKASPTSQFQAVPPLAARAKPVAIFVKKIDYRYAIRYRPAEPPTSPRDQNSIFVTNYHPSESAPSDPVAGQRADCRGRGFQFSSRDFLIAEGSLVPTLISTDANNLDFRTEYIP